MSNTILPLGYRMVSHLVRPTKDGPSSFRFVYQATTDDIPDPRWAGPERSSETQAITDACAHASNARGHV